ncbi:MAG: DUF3575 domain-containing protein [Lepagella sp.]
MNIQKVIISVLVLGCSGQLALGQQEDYRVDYRVGKSKIESTYRENAYQLGEIKTYLESIKQDSTGKLTEIIFCGYASPEGPIKLNEELADRRRQSIEEYVRRHFDIPEGVTINYVEEIAWSALAEMVAESELPDKEEVLEIINSNPGKSIKGEDSRIARLQKLDKGIAWRYITRYMFPRIRNSVVVFKEETGEMLVQTPEGEYLGHVAIPGKIEVIERVSRESEKKRFYMDIKTNMLYDIMALPNLGIEFYLGRGWSISGGCTYAWWKSDRRHRYWRAYGGELSVRKWIGKAAKRKPLTGHHIGIYGEIFTYDFEWGGKGYMGGSPGHNMWHTPNYAAGIEYGYSLPIANRLNIDFTIGVGYWGGKYFTYTPQEGHYVWESTKQRHWIGPTKAEISLVWLIGRGNSNKKGGNK